MQVMVGQGLSVTGQFTVTEDHQGAPGLAHGGLLASAFDEVLGSLTWLLGTPAVTGRLETDFRRPVPVGSVLFIDAHVLGVAGRKIYTRADGRLDRPDGPLALTAGAVFVAVPIEHFRSAGRAQDVQAAAEAADVQAAVRAFEVNP